MTTSSGDQPPPGNHEPLSAEVVLEFVLQRLTDKRKERLSDVQRSVFIKVWQGKSYKEIVREIKQEENRDLAGSYISQDVGPKLYKLISAALELDPPLNKMSFKGGIQDAYRAQVRFLERDRQPVEHPADSPPDPVFRGMPVVDWGTAPADEPFWGRANDLEQLKSIILLEGYRLIILYGLIGIGKTALAAELVRQLRHEFSVVVWRSFADGSNGSLEDLIADLVRALCGALQLPTNQLDQPALLRLLTEHRCLIVLDGLEAVLQPGVHDGSYRPEYRGLKAFWQRLGQQAHSSCVLVTSQDSPKDVEEINSPKIRHYVLKGLREVSGREILTNHGVLAPPDQDWRSLVDRFAGHPIVLRRVALDAQNFGNNIAVFLEQMGSEFAEHSYLCEYLQETLARLSPAEKILLKGLTGLDGFAKFEDLYAQVFEPLNHREQERLTRPQVLDVVQSLTRRVLIEKSGDHYMAPGVVTQYFNADC